MKIPADVIPPEVRKLLNEIADRGYMPREELYDSASFGNALIILGSEDTLIRLTRERSKWLLEVAAEAGKHWFEPIVWHVAFKTSTSLPLQELPWKQEAALLLEDLPQIEAANRDVSKELLADLHTLQMRRAEAATSPG